MRVGGHICDSFCPPPPPPPPAAASEPLPLRRSSPAQDFRCGGMARRQHAQDAGYPVSKGASRFPVRSAWRHALSWSRCRVVEARRHARHSLLTPPYWCPASQLCDLTVLNVSLNGLEDIPAELGSMSKLESLNMNDNRMKTVPDVVRFAATLCSPR
eukprot:COSAG02_NODE_1092_length_14622_cov_95.061971_4_plen_157_part_00